MLLPQSIPVSLAVLADSRAQSCLSSPVVAMDSVHVIVQGDSLAVVCLVSSFCDCPGPPAACVLLFHPGPQVGGDGCSALVLVQPGGFLSFPFRHVPPGHSYAEASLVRLLRSARSLFVSGSLFHVFAITFGGYSCGPSFVSRSFPAAPLPSGAWRFSGGPHVIRALFLQLWLAPCPLW